MEEGRALVEGGGKDPRNAGGGLPLVQPGPRPTRRCLPRLGSAEPRGSRGIGTCSADQGTPDVMLAHISSPAFPGHVAAMHLLAPHP